MLIDFSKRTILLATDGRGSLRTSVSSVWGPKALDGVLDVDLELDVQVDPVMARREGITETFVFFMSNGDSSLIG